MELLGPSEGEEGGQVCPNIHPVENDIEEAKHKHLVGQTLFLVGSYSMDYQLNCSCTDI